MALEDSYNALKKNEIFIPKELQSIVDVFEHSRADDYEELIQSMSSNNRDLMMHVASDALVTNALREGDTEESRKARQTAQLKEVLKSYPEKRQENRAAATFLAAPYLLSEDALLRLLGVLARI